MKNAAYRLVHDVVIAAHNLRNPTREEWDIYLEMVAGLKVKFDGDCSKFRQLIFTDGGSPTVAQRRAVVDLARGLANHGKVRVVIVSRSVIARGVVTAFRWLGFPMGSFAPDELEEAFAFLGLSTPEVIDICAAVEELGATVDGSVRSASRVEAHRLKLSA